jgi:hypothetical protein
MYRCGPVLAAVLAAGSVPARALPAAAVVPARISRHQTDDMLNGVASVSARDAWAVGQSGNRALIEYWNGRRWAVVAPARLAGSPSASTLLGVAATARMAWAVGTETLRGRTRTLIESWDGLRWRHVASPSAGTRANVLYSVAITSRRSAWAVGTSRFGPDVGNSLIEQWNGRSWRRVPSPAGAGYTVLFGVTAQSAASTWAVGQTGLIGTPLTLTVRLTRGTWQVVPSPTPGSPAAGSVLSAVAARSAGSAWAVGSPEFGPNLTERWSRGSWHVRSAPGPRGALNGVAILPHGRPLAVGDSVTGPIQLNLAEMWNGTAWVRVRSANPGTSPNIDGLNGVAASGPASAWAVGTYFEYGSGFRTLIERWNGKAWQRAASPSP